MKIIAIEHDQPDSAAQDFAPLLKAEALRAWELQQEGTVREIYMRADEPCAVLVLECPDAESAQAALDTLPLVQAGLIHFELVPLKAYPGFGRLFEPAALKAKG